MSSLVRLRVVSALVLLLGGALFSSYGLLKTPPPSQPFADDVSACEARFSRAKRFLPRHGVVCYLPGFNGSEAAKKEFFMARYALAPLVVRDVPDCDPLLGDFPLGPPSSLRTTYRVVEDFGHGVLLLKRNGP